MPWWARKAPWWWCTSTGICNELDVNVVETLRQEEEAHALGRLPRANRKLPSKSKSPSIIWAEKRANQHTQNCAHVRILQERKVESQTTGFLVKAAWRRKSHLDDNIDVLDTSYVERGIFERASQNHEENPVICQSSCSFRLVKRMFKGQGEETGQTQTRRMSDSADCITLERIKLSFSQLSGWFQGFVRSG